jgi:hypothetical protein
MTGWFGLKGLISIVSVRPSPPHRENWPPEFNEKLRVIVPMTNKNLTKQTPQ